MHPDSSGVARSWVVSGRVQGVGFRWFVKRSADALGLAGWTRNLPDGRVRVAARGPKEALDALQSTLRKGPPLARVDHVETEEFPHETDITNGFEIK